jgi:hypothetical protein
MGMLSGGGSFSGSGGGVSGSGVLWAWMSRWVFMVVLLVWPGRPPQAQAKPPFRNGKL